MGYQLRPLNGKLQVESTIHFKRKNRGENVIGAGESSPEPPARVPRIPRMMALAIWFDVLIHKGEVKNFAELAAFPLTWTGQNKDGIRNAKEFSWMPDRLNDEAT